MLRTLGEFLFSFSFTDALVWTSSALALVVYTFLIFNFYHFVAHRDVFKKEPSFSHPGVVGIMEDVVLGVLRLIHYGVMFPVVSFIWFLGFASLLFLIVQNQTIEQTTLIAISLIVGARILSYYNEDAAQELSKTVAIVILGAALIEPNFFRLDQLYTRALALPALGATLLHFIIYLSILEMSLRLLYHVKRAIFDDELGTKPKSR